jgi:hypothetical protein
VQLTGFEPLGTPPTSSFWRERDRRIGLELQRELERRRHVVACRLRRAQRLRIAQSLAIDRIVRGEAHAPVVPRRLRVPLIEEVEEPDADAAGKRELQVRIPLHFLGLRYFQQVRDVHLRFNIASAC